jgi:hypothetical protein
VTSIEEAKVSRTHIGGLFATVDMKTLGNGGNLVLHVVEMLKAENNMVKKFAITDMKSSGIDVGELSA